MKGESEISGLECWTGALDWTTGVGFLLNILCGVSTPMLIMLIKHSKAVFLATRVPANQLIENLRERGERKTTPGSNQIPPVA